MKKAKKLTALALAAVTAASLVACGSDTTETPVSTTTDTTTTQTTTDVPEGGTGLDITETVEADLLTFAEGTTLRMACGYNNKKTGITFDAETVGDVVDENGNVTSTGSITLADGNTYYTGDLKPTWVELEKRLGMSFESVYQGNSAKDEFAYWKDQLDQVDMVAGPASTLSEQGAAGNLVNLAEYLDMMPNFKAYLEANPIVRLSITGSTTGENSGAIYFSPYFDGVNDIERMPLMRTDWVVALLDGDGEFTAEACGNTAAPVYEAYMPTSGSVSVDVVKADGSAAETITKNYDAYGNIVAKMNEAGSMDGVTAVNMLREYIDATYDGYYGTTRSNLFCGQSAAWDADELVALLRCVVANSQTLNGTDSVQGIFSREDNNTQRKVDLFRFAGVLFGVRGLESRMDYLYIDADGTLKDARSEEATYDAMEKMNALVKEGLIASSFVNNSEESSSTMLENDLGFMSYDYNQTQTIMNKTKLQAEDGEQYMAVMVPVARWYDGTDANGVYMRFTESWRSVKTDAWAISAAGVAGDQDKLYAALKLIDYAYSADGMILMSYGPDAFIKTNADGSYVTFNFNGTEMPVIADATYDELWEKAKGNYTNYARFYLGSTLSFVKSQAFEYQCTHEVGKIGAGYISNAIALGTIKHPELAITSNPWYTSIPTVLPNTTVENDSLNTYTDLKDSFSTSKGGENLLLNIMVGGYSGEGTSSREETVNTVFTTYSGQQYLAFKTVAWQRLVDFYNAQ